MKLTFSTLACPAWTLDEIIHHAHAKGMDGVDFRGIGTEIDITRLPAFTTDLTQTLRKLSDNQLQMPCLNSSITLLTPEADKWEAMLGEARRYAELARKTGTGFLRIFGGDIPVGMTPESARELGQFHLREVVDITRPCGCKPLLETHDAWVLCEQVLSLLDGFEPAEAGALWDLEHPWRAGESPWATAAGLGGRIEHVHIKDTIRKDGRSRPVLLGAGELPLEECLTALRQIHYSGWICLETEKRWHGDGPEPEVSVPQFAEYMVIRK